MEAAVSSSELACSSVREDKSWLPAAIWPEAVAMVSVPWRTSPTTRARLAFMSFKACINWPVSSRLLTSMWLLRSPAATVSASLTAWARGRVMLEVSNQAHATPNTVASTPSTPISVRLAWASLSTSLAMPSMFVRCMSTRSCKAD
ncbi:hypothetical protein D3C78_1454840 [compost metagenome]